MRKIAIIGAGNVGISAAKAVLESSDMMLCGFVRRIPEPVPGFEKIPAAKSVFELPEKPEGVIVCVPSRLAEKAEKELLEAGIYTVDAFDIHEELVPMKKRLRTFAEKGKSVGIIGAGWDPGLDSVIRTLMLSAFPEGEIQTNFGPGMSMGHSAAARFVPGVLDAVSITLPLGGGKHFRKIYILPEEKADKNAVEHAVLSDGYFEHGRCSIEFVNSLGPFFDTKHGVLIENIFEDQRMAFSMKIDNPTLTGRILVSAMRAAFLKNPGAYFMTEISPVCFCENGWERYL